MNEEEKKAVERIEDTFYSDLGKGINKFQKITLYEDSIRDVRIILNLIEKMKNCIDILDDELKERNKTINEKEITIEKLQKENEELKNQEATQRKINELLVQRYSNSIPVQKVKDIQKEKEWILESYYCDEADYKQSQAIGAWSILQELLEGRK